MKNSVILKSFQNGISVIMDSSISFEELLENIAAKFREADGFFKNASVAVSLEGRELTEDQEREILDAITQNSRLNILCLMGKDEEKNLRFLGVQNHLNFQEDENSGQFYRGTLHDGASIETEHSIIILGDVCAGSRVYSNKDVWCSAPCGVTSMPGLAETITILSSPSISIPASFRSATLCTAVSQRKLQDGDFTNSPRQYQRSHTHTTVQCSWNLLQKNCWTILPSDL